MSEFTQILERVEHGDPKAAAELLPMVYAELRRLAAQKMANEVAGHTVGIMRGNRVSTDG